MEWRYVFLSCAIIVAINWLILLTFPEPEKEQLSELEKRRERTGFVGTVKVLWDSIIGICEPRLLAFLVIYMVVALYIRPTMNLINDI